MTDELLALLIEVTSVGIAGAKLKKPITGLHKAFAPKHQRPKGAPRQTVTRADAQAAFAKGLSVLAATSKGVRA